MIKMNKTTMIGLVFLTLGSLSIRFLHRYLIPSEDLADGVTGLLYGLAIGCMLLGIRRARGASLAVDSDRMGPCLNREK